MIRGYVTACNTGIVTQLPEPLEWELVRADKAERDSFSGRAEVLFFGVSV